MPYKGNVISKKEEEGYYAYYPELEGYQTQGSRRMVVPFNSSKVLHPKVVKQILKDIRE